VRSLAAARDRLHDLVAQPSIVAARWTSPAMIMAFGVAWVLSTAVVVLTFWLVMRRMHRVRRSWPLAELAGSRVRVSPEVGPLVAGIVRPEIVVPRWIIDRHPDEQRLVISHEAEHVRVHDPVLLAAACMLVAAMPWNPALWYMLARLRLAVELDCDGRVLRRGAPAHSYGALLIDVAERASRLRLDALALADDGSHLHQRILAMGQQHTRSAIARGITAGLVATIAVIAACTTEPPTAAEIAQADAATATKAAHALALASGHDTSVQYVVDGVAVTPEQARAIAPDRILTVNIVKLPTGASQIVMTTMKRKQAYLGDSAYVDSPRIATRVKERIGHEPVIYIDGVKSDNAALQALDPKTIQQIEVIKGAAVAAEYPNDPSAKDGVIRVTTKK
jgi:beta-lactamase regulating signal transducer with metallopeptidase domain